MPPSSSLARATLRIAALAVLATATGALAQSRPSTTRLPCAQAQALVAARGAVVLDTGPMTYDRFVRAAHFCVLGERAEPSWVPTADTPQCPIGFRCVSRPSPSRN